MEPELIICDEPISALDVSIQAQVVNMLEDLQDEMGLTYLFIAHDLSMVKHISDRIGVMYLGQLAEVCESEELYLHPLHPYTQALLSAIPIPDPRKTRSQKRIVLQGDVQSPINPKNNCRFCTRCPKCEQICKEQAPEMREVGARPLRGLPYRGQRLTRIGSKPAQKADIQGTVLYGRTVPFPLFMHCIFSVFTKTFLDIRLFPYYTCFIMSQCRQIYHIRRKLLMKRVFSVLLVCALAISLLTTVAFAEGRTEMNWNLGSAGPKTMDPGLNGASDGGDLISQTFEGLVREKSGRSV